MATDPTAFVAELPPWLQWGANAALFVVTAFGGLWALRKGHREGKERDEQPFDAGKFLDASPIRKLIAAAEGIAHANQATADNAIIQTIAIKTIAAALTLHARKLDPSFDERQIERDIEVRLAQMRLLREAK